MIKKPNLDWLKTKGHVAEAKARLAEDAAQRKAAEKAPNSIIFGKQDAQGEYDAHRALLTTLGGQHRLITATDLGTFRANIKKHQARFASAGITPKQIISLASSQPIRNPTTGSSDLSRADAEIRVSIPVTAMVTAASGRKSLDVRFQTNAGPNSEVTRHNVLVRFFGYDEQSRALTATPTAGERPKKAITPKQAANALRRGYLAFECDCKRHRFFFRYLATAGGFNAGRDEHGYPKLTNPGLHGVACKHVLRTMAEINSSTPVLGFLERAMTKALLSADNTVRHQQSQADARAMAAKQQATPRVIAALAEAAKKASPKKTARPRTRKLASSDAETRARAAATLAKEFGMSPEKLLALLAAHK